MILCAMIDQEPPDHVASDNRCFCWLHFHQSVRKERMAENLAIFDFELSADEMNSIATLDSKQSVFFDHRDPATVKAVGSSNIHD